MKAFLGTSPEYYEAHEDKMKYFLKAQYYSHISSQVAPVLVKAGWLTLTVCGTEQCNGTSKLMSVHQVFHYYICLL